MDRDEVAGFLAVPLCGLAFALAAIVMSKNAKVTSEGAAWRRLWLPSLLPALCGMVLLGSAVAFPEEPQGFGPTQIAASIPFLIVIARSLLRAVRGLRTTRSEPAQVVGLIRCHVRIAPEFRAALSRSELHAVVLHEHAHARHFDPLRIWLARIVTDLQWPFRGAPERYRMWLHELELARDAEACSAGADGLDLASALVKAAGTRSSQGSVGAALKATEETSLRERLRRLVDEAFVLHTKPARPWTTLVVLWLLGIAFAVGIRYGQFIVPLLAT